MCGFVSAGFLMLVPLSGLLPAPAGAQSYIAVAPLSGRVKELEKLGQTEPRAAIEQLREIDADNATGDDVRREVKALLVDLLLRTDRRAEAKEQIAALKALGVNKHDQEATVLSLLFDSTLKKFDGDSEQAAAIIEKAIALAAGTHDDALVYQARETATEIYLDMGQFPTALAHALAGLEALKGETPEIRRRRAVALDIVSQIYASLKDGKKALEYNDRARAMMRSAGDGYAEGFDIDRGNAYSLLGDAENARKAFEDALAAARHRSSNKRELIALVNLANLLRGEKQYTQCVRYAQAGLRLAEKVQVSEYLYATEVSLGLCHIDIGSVSLGQAEVARGMEGLRKTDNMPDLESAYDELATANENAGRYKEALEALREQHKIADSLFRTDQSRTMAQMQARFDAAERQRKIELLEEEKKTQEEELRNKNLERLLVVLSAVVVALIAFVAVREKEKLRREAHKANLDKSQFLANAAHDLRQPMQAIGNLLEAARHAFTRGDTVKSEELVLAAQSATQIMRSSFNSVLELSRLDAGALTASYSEFDLAELIEEVRQAMLPLADQAGVHIRVRQSKKKCMVRSDRHLMTRVLFNLMSNAVKYSDPRKKERAIVVGAIALGRSARIAIVDNGIGIAESERDNIFKPFFQIDNPGRDRELGLGLGLSIVRSIVDLLEGHALAMHSRLGLGTRFYVDLPRTEGLQGIARTVIEEMPALDVAGTYVLYVEDDSLVRTSTEALLAEFGVLCDVSRSYEELSGKLSRLERMPDIILTDFRLSSEHTAIDVIAAVRAEFDARIPVILLTGESEGFSPPQELGEVVILRKPVSASALLAQVQRIVSASKAGQR
ncbi:MAG TPA: ATP-binding protein [Burkholderiaceae bacterium]